MAWKISGFLLFIMALYIKQSEILKENLELKRGFILGANDVIIKGLPR